MSLLFRTSATGSPGIGHSVVRFPETASDPAAVAEAVTDWLDSDALTELLARFDRRLAPGSVQERLAEAERTTRDIFDFRNGGERWEARSVEVDAGTVDAIEATVAPWFREPSETPVAELGPVTHALVLGGRIHSCVLRSELLAALAAAGLRPGAVWGLGSDRPAGAGEQEVAADLGQGSIENELDAMCATLSWAFDLDAPRPSEDGVRRWPGVSPPMAGLSAPAPAGARRATTSDTYRFFRSVCGDVTADDHLLVVTSAIHAPFQHAQALAELSLPTGAHIRTVGAHIGTSTKSMVRDRWTPGEWLQEIRSAIWSLRTMYERMVTRHPEIRSVT